MVVSKSDFVKEVAYKAGTSKKDAERAIDAVFGTIAANAKKGNSVRVLGFGTFETVVVPERWYDVNGQKGISPAHRVVKFRISNNLKEFLK